MNFIKNNWDIISVYLSFIIGCMMSYTVGIGCSEFGCVVALFPLFVGEFVVLLFIPITIFRTFYQHRKKIRLLWLIPHALILLLSFLDFGLSWLTQIIPITAYVVNFL
jgi:hypothetical protein